MRSLIKSECSSFSTIIRRGKKRYLVIGLSLRFFPFFFPPLSPLAILSALFPHLPSTMPQGYWRTRTRSLPTRISSLLAITAKGKSAYGDIINNEKAREKKITMREKEEKKTKEEVLLCAIQEIRQKNPLLFFELDVQYFLHLPHSHILSYPTSCIHLCTATSETLTYYT